MDAVTLLISDARGIYIPRDFVTGFDLSQWQGIKSGDAMICENPEHEMYWEAWSAILDNATFTCDPTFERGSHTWHLHQDGDLWAVCYELMTDEEKQNFGFES